MRPCAVLKPTRMMSSFIVFTAVAMSVLYLRTKVAATLVVHTSKRSY